DPENRRRRDHRRRRLDSEQFQVSLRTCHSVGGKLGKPTRLVMVARTREPGHALPEAAAPHIAAWRRSGRVAARGTRPRARTHLSPRLLVYEPARCTALSRAVR